MRWISLILIVHVVVVPAAGIAAEVWDLANGFSLHQNPNGPWSLGAKSSLTDSLVGFTNNAAVSAQYATSQLVGWSPTGRVVPYIAQNASDTNWSFNGSTLAIVEPGEILVHPDSQMSVVRWTAPHPGEVKISATFRRFEDRFGFQSGFRVTHNDHELPKGSGVLAGFGGPSATASYKHKLMLDADDFIEFIVDFGPDGNSAADGTILGATIAYVPVIAVLGDFNGNGTLDIGDLNQLDEQIQQGTNFSFDLDENNRLDQEDRRIWVEDLKRTYFGDSNLDGEFDSGDLIAVFAVGKFENGIPRDTSWSEGDWNGDADFDSSDIVVAFSGGGYEVGPRTVVAVPEPSAVVLGVLGITTLFLSRSRYAPVLLGVRSIS